MFILQSLFAAAHPFEGPEHEVNAVQWMKWSRGVCYFLGVSTGLWTHVINDINKIKIASILYLFAFYIYIYIKQVLQQTFMIMFYFIKLIVLNFINGDEHKFHF